jgi:hypothetical protein
MPNPTTFNSSLDDTGERAPSMVTRQENEQAARAYAEAAIARAPDLLVAEILARPSRVHVGTQRPATSSG